MEEFVPYILLLLAWHPDHPGEFGVERRLVVSSKAECQKMGHEAVEARKIYAFEYGGTKFEYLCIPSASSNEKEEAWQEHMDQLNAERPQPDKEEGQ